MNEISDTVRDTSRLGTVWGIAVLILGVLALMMPLAFGLTTTLLTAILLIAAGIAQTIYAFNAGSFGKGLLQFLFGGISILGGIAMMAMPGVGLLTLTIAVIAYFLVDGISTIVAGFRLRPVKGWGWMLFSGIVSVVLAVMIYREFPAASAYIIGILVGIRMIFAGWSMILLGAEGEKASDDLKQAVG